MPTTKKKKVRKKRQSPEPGPGPQAQPQVLPPEKQSLEEKLKNVFQNKTPPLLQAGAGGEVKEVIGTTSRASEFEKTATELEDKYKTEGEETPEPGAQASAEGDGSQRVPLDSPEARSFVSPQTMRKILALIFNSLARVHGENWRVDADELDLLEPFNTDMVNEIVNKVDWLRDSEYKATIAWAGMMGLFIATRSKAGAQLLENLADKIASMFRRDDTKPSSPESSDTSRPQATEKPS